jgi:RNA polymerase sigma-70 factor (ECF subfamily)
LFEKPGVNDTAERAFRRHYDDVFRFVLRRSRDRQRAEDLTQQVFADAVAGLRDLPSSPPLAWLYTVARRRFADEARRDTLARRLKELEPVPFGAGESRDYGSALTASLSTAIARLPDGQREVVVLKLLRGAKFAEIGAQMDISTEAAKMRFVRALEALRAELEEEGLQP